MKKVERILRLPEVLQARGRSKAQHYNDIRAGRFPKGLKLGDNAVGWLESDVLAEQQRLIAERDGRSGGESADQAAA